MEAPEGSLIDLYITKEHVILSRSQSSLWCCKKTGEMLLNTHGFDASQIESTVHIGKVWGCIGKLRFFTDGEWKLLLISQAFCVGTLPQGSKVYCVEKITIIPLTMETSAEIVGLETSFKVTESLEKSAIVNSISSLVPLGTELGDMASGGAPPVMTFVKPPSPTLKQKFRHFVTDSEKSKELRDREKVERRLTEALLVMFNDSRSFYFSTDFDLTQTLQRKSEQADQTAQLPHWKTVDDRFFWNKWMLADLIENNYKGEASDPWILPLTQGYVEIRQIPITTQTTPDILQPGWNTRYAEKRSFHADSTTAALKEDSLNTIQSSEGLSGSGYESDSESEGDSGSEEDDSQLEERMAGVLMEVTKERTEESVEASCQVSGETVKLEDPGKIVDHEGSVSRCTQEGKVTIVIDDSCKHDQSAVSSTVPPLSSLCQAVLGYDYHGNQGDCHGDPANGLTVDKLRPESDLSNLESDYFANSSAKVSEEEGWVSVRSEEVLNESVEEAEEKPPPCFTLAIISRRSRHRAGTRYRRRGVDKNGNVANYVETEMLAQCGTHVISYVIVRGSVPIYWTQPGYKYRPPPVIERDDEETQEALQKHFSQQFDLYKLMVVVNLVKQSGKEKVLSDAFEKQILQLDNEKLTYIVFDFHSHLVDTEQPGSVLCRQESIYRVNCMDCLDRTNVTQSVFAREVLQSALQKLGVISFEEKLEGPMLTSFKEMWGNNGDYISKQYAGTVAMKGDITRYGERKLAGMMKDGYNSAQRYYLNIFRDTYRQVLIDLMQGVSPAEAFSSLPSSMQGTDELEEIHTEDSQTLPTTEAIATPTFEVGGDEEEVSVDVLDREEAVMDIIKHCKNEVFPNKSLHLQCWALVEPAGHSFIPSSGKEELCILIHCKENEQLTLVSYSMEIEQIVCLLRIPMDSINKIVIGPLGMYLRSSRRLHMRIYYSFEDFVCYLTFRTVFSRPSENDRADLMSIADALNHLRPDIQVTEHKLPKKKSLEHQGVIYLVVPNSFMKSLDEQQSYDEGKDHVTDAPPTESGLVRSPSKDSIASNKNGESQPLSSDRPLSRIYHSCDDILSATVHSPTLPTAPTLPITHLATHNPTSSLSADVPNGAHQSTLDSQLELQESSPPAGQEGSLKRASSDTILNSTENDGIENRVTKFTGKLFQNLLQVGKSLKQRTSRSKQKLPVDLNNTEPRVRSVSELVTQDSNGDSDSGSTKWPRRLQQRWRTNMPLFKTGLGRTNTLQTDPSEEETRKNEMRARSKSKIIIV